MQKLHLEDPVTGPVSHHFQDGLMAACAVHPQLPPTQRLLGQWQLRNWVLGKRYVDYDDSEWLQLIVLCSFWNKILAGSHFGEEKTMSWLQARFCWPGQ